MKTYFDHNLQIYYMVIKLVCLKDGVFYVYYRVACLANSVHKNNNA
jgi:hypothetical protein